VKVYDTMPKHACQAP